MSIVSLPLDADWIAALESIERAFANAKRPTHFTNYTHCCECSDEDIFFEGHTPESLNELRYPETIGIAFLTPEAFHYFMPTFAQMLRRKGPDYCVGDVLFHIENRLDTFDGPQLRAVRNLLYLAYERLHDEIEATAFDYPSIWRVLNRLDAEAPSA